LHGLFFEKGGLQRVKLFPFGEAFDGGYLFVPDRAHRQQARTPRDSLDQHGAGAALSFATSVLASREIQFVA
jgi:hypothetical protein